MFWELFVLVSLWECQNLACASIDRTEHGLHKALIERYPSVYARPVFNHTETVRVELGLALIQLNELVDVSHFSNLEDIDLNDYIRHHEWRVVKTYARRNVKYYPCCVEPYLDITYTLILKREGGRFVPMLVAPAVMMSLLLPVMFVLPVESGEKMTLGIGILLVIVLMLDMLNEYIMTSFYTMPLLVSYYIACLILTSISLALSACVVNVAHNKRRMPTWLRKVVAKSLTYSVCWCLSCGGSKNILDVTIFYSLYYYKQYHVKP